MRELGREVVDADLLIATSYKRTYLVTVGVGFGVDVLIAVKKLPRPQPRALEQAAKMTLEDLEGLDVFILSCCAFVDS